MKTRNQYLSDLEFSSEEFQNLTSKDIKKRYRKLVLKYNVDNQKNNSNTDKYRVILEAYEALSDNKYLDEPIVEEKASAEETAEIYNKAVMDFLEKGAFEINLKKSDNKVVIVDNYIINFHAAKLTKRKYLVINRNKVLKFTRNYDQR